MCLTYTCGYKKAAHWRYIRLTILFLTVQKYCFYLIYANFSAIILRFLNILHTFHKKSTLSSALLPFEVAHHVLQVLGILLGDFGSGRVVVFGLEEVGEHLLRGHALRISHRVHRGISAFRHELQFEPVAATVALDDAADFPELYIV